MRSAFVVGILQRANWCFAEESFGPQDQEMDEWKCSDKGKKLRFTDKLIWLVYGTIELYAPTIRELYRITETSTCIIPVALVQQLHRQHV